MTKPKIYTVAHPEDLSPPVKIEGFCVDVVLASDYAELEREFSAADATITNMEAKVAALAAENAVLKRFPDQVVKFIGTLGTSEIGSDTKDKIEMAAKRVKTTATDTAIAEMRAQGVDMFADFCSTANNGHEINPDVEEIRKFAQQLRAEASK